MNSKDTIQIKDITNMTIGTTTIAIKKELDPDFGDCYYCYINNVKQKTYVRISTPDAKQLLLETIIAHQQETIKNITRQASNDKKIVDNLQVLVASVTNRIPII